MRATEKQEYKRLHSGIWCFSIYFAKTVEPYMCGIAGSVNFPFSEEKVYQQMAHRGPDEQDSYRNQNIQFYHLRLSIQDIACGKQPMHLHEKYTIIY